jgi:hypothetical protein
VRYLPPVFILGVPLKTIRTTLFAISMMSSFIACSAQTPLPGGIYAQETVGASYESISGTVNGLGVGPSIFPLNGLKQFYVTEYIETQGDGSAPFGFSMKEGLYIPTGYTATGIGYNSEVGIYNGTTPTNYGESTFLPAGVTGRFVDDAGNPVVCSFNVYNAENPYVYYPYTTDSNGIFLIYYIVGGSVPAGIPAGVNFTFLPPGNYGISSTTATNSIVLAPPFSYNPGTNPNNLASYYTTRIDLGTITLSPNDIAIINGGLL